MAKKERKSSFRGKVSANAQKTKSQGASYGYLNLPKSVRVYSPTPGAREKIDIVPYVVKSAVHPDKDTETEIALPGTEWYKRPFKVHKNVGTDNDTVVCLNSFGKKCPICDYRKERASAGAEKEELRELNPSRRNLYYVIPRGVKKHEEEVHIFDFSNYLFQELLIEELEENEDYGIFPDTQEGLTLRIRWSEESFNGKAFAKAGRIDFLERDEAIDDSIVEGLPDLDSLLQEMSYDTLKDKFFEIDNSVPDTDENDDEDAPPVRKKKSVKPEKQEITWSELLDMDADELFEVAEDEALDIDIDEYEEEEDLRKAVAEGLGVEVPKKKKPVAKKPEPEEEDDDDEDAPPVKKHMAKKPESNKPAKQTEGECPGGGTFGKDTDELDECDNCPLWDSCFDANI